MTNYTYEQRKTIVEYLKNKVLPRQYKIEDQPDDNLILVIIRLLISAFNGEFVDELQNH